MALDNFYDFFVALHNVKFYAKPRKEMFCGTVSVTIKPMKNYLFLLVIGVFIYGCSQVQRATDLITKPSARELYLRTLDVNVISETLWNDAFMNAKTNQLQAPIPFVIATQSFKYKAIALAYKINLKKGSVFKLIVEKNIDSGLVFIDLYPFNTDSTLSKEPLVSNDWQIDSISYTVERSGVYKVIIQPELRDSLKFTAKMYTQPSFAFPVVGKGNAAIGSRWGVARDGGKRSHEGIDVFAVRGNPVVAATDGVVSFTGEKGLGGKQVWLHNGLWGQSLYYAHLDSIIVTRGARVKRGDTLGLVGNTGNARTTPPHLHFGIYTRSGAINPLPFVELQDVPVETHIVAFDSAVTKLKNNQLRTGPATKFPELMNLPRNHPIVIVGKTHQWYHVKVADSLEGFINQSLLQKQTGSTKK
ncbi:M23 family metallopeptidase [Gelidibacter salicanalis]|uniref:M23 family metallopeptidase n=1 Tax=Gelidibacter salicanalis TaxID=291193 RepID=A0A5C7AP80_9FLAO|nr:M23 family metallopeptidase [Gelidibacter salicanalis]TXE09479.1 M23 family metallopeptidase [Gelidibacter salicanalis]